MAACKSTVDANYSNLIHVPADSLPITFTLQRAPNGVTIAEAKYFPAGSNAGGTVCTLLNNNLTFTFPAPAPAAQPKKGQSFDVYVRVQGAFPAGTTIFVVEDCDQQTLLMAIDDDQSKLSDATLEVD